MKRILRFFGFQKPPPIQAIVYTREGCGLCTEAADLLKAEGFAVKLIDIDSNPELRERYDVVIPVVEIDGKERFRGRINPVLLRRLARAAATRPPIEPENDGLE